MPVKECRLTTIDNPYDPFTEFQSWYLFDVVKGYNTSQYLGRISKTTPSMTDEEEASEIERAIDEILDNDFLGIYKKVVKK
ncbi:MAG: hypothetical protein J6Y02_21430 [Pseudobutyrivibrio sp.]|nr:hypothetical protein [Pseudobutyrivibrio sp.]